jgi:hemerythrin-like domain-containing protein
MDIVTFLEKMANKTHHSSEINDLISKQSSQIQKVFLENNADILKKEISNVRHYTDNVAVAI